MEKIDFIATDGIELNGILYKADNNIGKVILSVHGMTSNCFKKREDIIAKEANRNGIDYFVLIIEEVKLLSILVKKLMERLKNCLQVWHTRMC